MNHMDVFSTFKDRLRDLISDDLEKGIDQIKEVVNNQSDKKVELHGLDGQLNEINRDIGMGVISYADKMLFTNKVRMGMMACIEALTLDDIIINENPYLDESEARILKSQNEQVDASSSEIPATTSPDDMTTSPVNWQDLNIYMEKNNDWLRYYPVLKRHLYAHVYRKTKDGAMISGYLSDLNEYQSTMQAFRTILESANAKFWEIKSYKGGGHHFIQLEQFKEFKSKMNEENISDIEDQFKELQSFQQALKEDGLL